MGSCSHIYPIQCTWALIPHWATSGPHVCSLSPVLALTPILPPSQPCLPHVVAFGLQCPGREGKGRVYMVYFDVLYFKESESDFFFMFPQLSAILRPYPVAVAWVPSKAEPATRACMQFILVIGPREEKWGLGSVKEGGRGSHYEKNGGQSCWGPIRNSVQYGSESSP